MFSSKRHAAKMTRPPEAATAPPSPDAARFSVKTHSSNITHPRPAVRIQAAPPSPSSTSFFLNAHLVNVTLWGVPRATSSMAVVPATAARAAASPRGERTVRVDDDDGATRGGGGGGGGRAAVLAALEAHVGEGRLAASLDEDEAAESAAGVEEANAAKVEVAVFGDDEEAAAAHEVDGATAAGVQAGVFARRIRRDGDIALDGVSGGGPGDVVAVEGERVRHHHARDASVLERVVQLANVAHARLLADVRRAGAVRVRNVVVALPPRRELVPRPGLESTGRHNLGTGGPGVVCARPVGDVPDGRLEVHLRHREGETRERRDEQRRRSDRPRHHRDPRARTIRARLSAMEDATERGHRRFPAERAMLLLPAPACVKTTR